MRQLASYVCAALYSLTAALVLSVIVVLAAGDLTSERAYGAGPGLALIVVLQG